MNVYPDFIDVNLHNFLTYSFNDSQHSRLSLMKDKKSRLKTLIILELEDKKQFKKNHPTYTLTTSLKKIVNFVKQSQLSWYEQSSEKKVLEKQFAYLKQCIRKHNSHPFSLHISYSSPCEWKLWIKLKEDENSMQKTAKFDPQAFHISFDRLTTCESVFQVCQTLLNQPIECHFACKNIKELKSDACGYASHTLIAKVSSLFNTHDYSPTSIFDTNKKHSHAFFLSEDQEGGDLFLEIKVASINLNEVNTLIKIRHQELKNIRDKHYLHGHGDLEDYQKK